MMITQKQNSLKKNSRIGCAALKRLSGSWGLRLSFCAITGASLTSFAAVEVPLSLPEVLRKTVSYSPDISGAAARIHGAEAKTDETKAQIFPTISFLATATEKQNSQTFTTSYVPTTTTSAYQEQYQAGLNLAQPLYVGGAITSGVNLYKAMEEQSRQDFYNVKQTTLVTAITAFYTLAQTESQLQIALNNRDFLKSYVDLTRQYARIGRSRELDLMQAQSTYATALTNAEALQTQIVANSAALNRLIGAPINQVYKTTFHPAITPLSPMEFEQAFDAAVHENPQIRSLDLQAEQVDYSEGVDLAQDNPNLALAAFAGYISPTRDQLFNGSSESYSVGLTLNIPIFSGLSSLDKRRYYTDQKVSATRATDSAKDTLKANLESEIATLHSLERQIETAISASRDGHTALDLAAKGYRQGIASAQDVVVVQGTQNAADQQLVLLQFSYLNQLAALRQNMGIDMEKAYEK